ncbi:MAG: hypothetical protein DRJ67_05235 [Thermoprotei archaeon]|nr:MAG: hypothetical protein DRJ67_05235 [Thermoprotei archaeon]
MRIIYLVRVVEGRVHEFAPVLVFWPKLGEEELEELFRFTNMCPDVPSLTGWHEFTGIHDYVVDPDNMVAYECLPVGWRALPL